MAKLNQLGLLFETILEFRNQLYSFMLTLPDLKSYLGMTCLRELKLPTGGAGGFVDPCCQLLKVKMREILSF